MNPLFLVNWHAAHVRFRALMWVIAIALAIVILVEVTPSKARPVHAAPRGMATLAAGASKP